MMIPRRLSLHSVTSSSTAACEGNRSDTIAVAAGDSFSSWKKRSRNPSRRIFCEHWFERLAKAHVHMDRPWQRIQRPRHRLPGHSHHGTQRRTTLIGKSQLCIVTHVVTKQFDLIHRLRRAAVIVFPGLSAVTKSSGM